MNKNEGNKTLVSTLNSKTIHTPEKPIGRWMRCATTSLISSKIRLDADAHRKNELSCRACGAGVWALGLDSRWGSSAPLLLTIPTSDHLQGCKPLQLWISTSWPASTSDCASTRNWRPERVRPKCSDKTTRRTLTLSNGRKWTLPIHF